MGKYGGVTLDRDRAFDVNSLQELLTQGKAILNKAIDLSRRMEASISATAAGSRYRPCTGTMRPTSWSPAWRKRGGRIMPMTVGET